MRPALLVLYCLWSVTGPAAYAQDRQQLETLARDYIETLDRDLQRQATFYTDSTRFTDPTSALFGEPWDITGGTNIIEFLDSAARDSGTLSVVNRIDNLLVEPPFVVAHITSTVTSCGVGLGYPGRVFSGEIQLATVLQFEGDKLLTRTDYATYSDTLTKFDQIRSELSAAQDDPRCAQWQDEASSN